MQLDIPGLAGWCSRRKLNYMVQEDAGMVVVPRGPGDPPMRILALPDRPMAVFVTSMPEPVVEERRMAVLAAINLVNASSYMGAWVIQSDGAVYLRMTMPTRGVDWGDDGVMFVLDALMGTYDGIAPRLAAIGRGELTWDRVLSG